MKIRDLFIRENMTTKTKDELKELYNAPKEEEFDSVEEYIAAKEAWVEANPEKYEEITKGS